MAAKHGTHTDTQSESQFESIFIHILILILDLDGKNSTEPQKSTQKHVFLGLTKNTEKHIYRLGLGYT